MKENTCDKAIAILQATSDGDKLDPLDLKLVESAVNGFLSEEGIKVFNQFHETIVAGKYKDPWFHGIENMTIDHVGYVYWKGVIILENKGIPLNITTVIWRWVEGE